MLEPNDYVWGCDVKAAFKALSLHPAWHLCAVFRQRDPRDGVMKYWLPTRMMFGLTSAPGGFSLLSAEARQILSRVFNCPVWAYLDDFRGGAAFKPAASAQLALTKQFLASLGLDTADDKDELPSRKARVIGVLMHLSTRWRRRCRFRRR